MTTRMIDASELVHPEGGATMSDYLQANVESWVAERMGYIGEASNLRPHPDYEATIVRGVDLEKILPQEVLDGEEDFDEEEGEEGVLVKNIPMKALSMLDEQGEGIMGDIARDELSMTEGLPVLFYHTEKKQLIVDDGNHRIFQRWLAGQDTFDAYVYSGSYSNYLRHVHDGEEAFDWSAQVDQQRPSKSQGGQDDEERRLPVQPTTKPEGRRGLYPRERGSGDYPLYRVARRCPSVLLPGLR